MQDYRGRTIDRYFIKEQLGQGGMAVVYKAYDSRLEREVALKLIRTDEIPPSQHELLLKRFEREAKSQARFSHPNIVPIFDFGEHESIPYLVMSYLPGGTLRECLKTAFSLEQALAVLVPIASALMYAHQQGVIHRDIKPSNILFDHEGRPLLTDFGIAKLLETEQATLTGTGLGVGTPEYMAPEQWKGEVLPQTDIYSLGVVLYEMLTGSKPYTAETPVAVALKQMTEPFLRPTDLNPNIPDQAEWVLLKALAKQPEKRYASMAEFYLALVNLQAGESVIPFLTPVSAFSPSTLEEVTGSQPNSYRTTNQAYAGTQTVVDPRDSEATVDEGLQYRQPLPPRHVLRTSSRMVSSTRTPVIREARTNQPQDAEQQKMSWFTMLGLVLASSVGWQVGAAISTYGNRYGEGISYGLPIGWMIIGLLTGFLLKQLYSLKWFHILLITLGFIFGGFGGGFLYMISWNPWDFYALAGLALGGNFSGLVLGLVLRTPAKLFWWHIVMLTIGLGVCGLLATPLLLQDFVAWCSTPNNCDQIIKLYGRFFTFASTVGLFGGIVTLLTILRKKWSDWVVGVLIVLSLAGGIIFVSNNY